MATIARFLIAGLLLAPLAARAADPVAFISDLTGEVAMNGAGRPAYLAELLPGTRLSLGPGSGASVMYVTSGEEFSLVGPGEFVVARQGVKAEKGPAPTSRTAPLRASAAIVVQTSRAATASLRMRSAAPPKVEPSGPLYPVGAKIATLQPTLRWAGEAGETYSVILITSQGKEIYRGSVRGTSLRLPVRLAPDHGYAWSFSTGAGSSTQARFETLSAAAIATADKARAGANSFSERAQLAMILHEIGAAQDSRVLWAQLAAERPDIPELAGLAR